jgi:hypothetical protein
MKGIDEVLDNGIIRVVNDLQSNDVQITSVTQKKVRHI